MKKTIIITLILVFSMAITGCQNKSEVKATNAPTTEETTDEKDDANNVSRDIVEKITDYKCVFKDYNYDGGVIDHREFEYDEDGLELKGTLFDYNGNIKNYYTISYNENNQKIYETYYTATGEIAEKYIYDYDSNGNIIKQTGEITKTCYKYENDKNGNVVKRECYDESGEMLYSESIKYEYDENDRIKYEETYRDGKSMGGSEYSYDEKGNVSKVVSLGDTNRTIIYKYDDNNRKIKSEVYYGMELSSYAEWEYIDVTK